MRIDSCRSSSKYMHCKESEAENHYEQQQKDVEQHINFGSHVHVSDEWFKET